MKKPILTLCLALFMLSSFAQESYFELTPNGFISKQDNTKDFIVIEFDGVNQKDLFLKAKQFINKRYNNPKFVSSEIPDKQLVVDAVDSKEIKVIYQINGPNLWNFAYKYDIQFKDGKVRFQPTFKSLQNIEDSSEIPLIGASLLGNATGMFNKKGKVLREKGNKAVEESLNAFIIDFKKSISEKQDDW